MGYFDAKFRAYEKLIEVMEELQKEESFVFLPSFQCCGSCAWAELRGFVGTKPSSKFDGLKSFAFFNEQTAHRAADSCILDLSIGEFGDDNDDEAAIRLVKKALLEGDFQETSVNVESMQEVTDEIWNKFHATHYGTIKIYGSFSELEPVYEDDDEDF